MPKEVAGIDVGANKSPIEPVVQSFANHGIIIARESVTGWRMDKASGNGTVLRMDASNVLRDDDALNKDYVYLSVARAGVRNRRFGQFPRDHCLTGKDFIEDVAVSIKMSASPVRKAIRAMRAEVVFDPDQLTEDDRAIFKLAAGKFIEDFSQLPPSLVPPFIEEMENSDLTDIPNFYRAIYRKRNPATIGIWTPYEVAFMRYFYQNRIVLGSILSTFDSYLLDAAVKDKISEIVPSIKEKTGVRIDQWVLDEHRNFLLYGKPASPFWGSSD